MAAARLFTIVASCIASAQCVAEGAAQGAPLTGTNLTQSAGDAFRRSAMRTLRGEQKKAQENEGDEVDEDEEMRHDPITLERQRIRDDPTIPGDINVHCLKWCNEYTCDAAECTDCGFDRGCHGRPLTPKSAACQEWCNPLMCDNEGCKDCLHLGILDECFLPPPPPTPPPTPPLSCTPSYPAGINCVETGCCVEEGHTCFRKFGSMQSGYGRCQETCEKDADWTCEVVETSPPSPPVQPGDSRCGKTYESCWDAPHCCQSPEDGCYRRIGRQFAMCKPLPETWGGPACQDDKAWQCPGWDVLPPPAPPPHLKAAPPPKKVASSPSPSRAPMQHHVQHGKPKPHGSSPPPPHRESEIQHDNYVAATPSLEAVASPESKTSPIFQTSAGMIRWIIVLVGFGLVCCSGVVIAVLTAWQDGKDHHAALRAASVASERSLSLSHSLSLGRGRSQRRPKERGRTRGPIRQERVHSEPAYDDSRYSDETDEMDAESEPSLRIEEITVSSPEHRHTATAEGAALNGCRRKAAAAPAAQVAAAPPRVLAVSTPKAPAVSTPKKKAKPKAVAGRPVAQPVQRQETRAVEIAMKPAKQPVRTAKKIPAGSMLLLLPPEED